MKHILLIIILCFAFLSCAKAPEPTPPPPPVPQTSVPDTLGRMVLIYSTETVPNKTIIGILKDTKTNKEYMYITRELFNYNQENVSNSISIIPITSPEP